MHRILYTEIGQEGVRATETTESFFSDRFLRARIDSGQESNRGYIPEHEGSKSNNRLFEEDVNIYIIHGLNSLFQPVTAKLMRRFVVQHYSDLAEITEQMDRAGKYLLHKTNGDFLLFTLGLFGKPSNMPLPEEAYIDRGQSYYAFAAGYRLEIDGGRTSIVDVFEKLTINFRRYVDILRDIRNLGILPLGIKNISQDRQLQQTEQSISTASQEIGTLEAMLKLTDERIH